MAAVFAEYNFFNRIILAASVDMGFSTPPRTLTEN